ncbi:MAG: hypothetical protein ACKPKO_45535, partial [Candidatus Fonsibacter sp.]
LILLGWKLLSRESITGPNHCIKFLSFLHCTLCIEHYPLIIGNILLFQLGPEPPVLHVSLGSNSEFIMGAILHGAQFVKQPVLVELVSGPH